MALEQTTALSDRDKLQSKLSTTLCGFDCKLGSDSDPVSDTLEDVHVGALDVLRYDGFGVRGGKRTHRHICEDRIDDFYLLMPLSSPITISQSGRVAAVEPGSCVLLGTGRPFECESVLPASHLFSQFVVRLPAPSVRQQVPYADECCARTIFIRRGVGKVLRALLDTLIEERADYAGLRAERFGGVLLDTVVNTVLDTLDPERMPIRQPAFSRVFEQARQFIETRLSDPALDPAGVAQHCRISVSYLHSVFATAAAKGVSTFIREARLQRCREALQSPGLRHRSIMEIAMQWGFNSAPGFTRAYRSYFGWPPSVDREGGLSLDQGGKTLS